MLAICLLLSGCYEWREVVRLDSVQVTWERTAGGLVDHGLAEYDWNAKTCTIKAPDNDALIGHEMKHCFGWTH